MLPAAVVIGALRVNVFLEKLSYSYLGTVLIKIYEKDHFAIWNIFFLFQGRQICQINQTDVPFNPKGSITTAADILIFSYYSEK